MMHTMEDWKATIEAMHSGKVVEVEEAVYDYFLDALPPVHMGYRAQVANDAGDGTVTVYADFGFAEGADYVRAFWRGRGDQRGKFFCCQTKEINPHA